MDYIKRGIKVSLCFYDNFQTKYFMNEKNEFTINGKPTFQHIEGFQMGDSTRDKKFLF